MPQKKEDETLIHLKFDYNEALNSKRDILYTEKSLVSMLKIAHDYFELKNNKIITKTNLHKKFKEIKTLIKKLNEVLPQVSVPDVIKKKEQNGGQEVKSSAKTSKVKMPVTKKVKIQNYDNSIESQLNDIQERLRKLQG